MQEENPEDLQARIALIVRKELALEGLNMRIARLGIALGLELETDVGLRQALEPRRTLEPHQESFLVELRALLTLRYQMEKQWVDELGSQTLQAIVTDVEHHMQRIGFQQGVDGIHEEQLFDEAQSASSSVFTKLS